MKPRSPQCGRGRRPTARAEASIRSSSPLLPSMASSSWLRDTIPGAADVVEIDGARLFIPDERAAELTAALRRHWDTRP